MQVKTHHIIKKHSLMAPHSDHTEVNFTDVKASCIITI